MRLTTYVCNGPRCSKGQNNTRLVLSIDETEIQNPNYLPPDDLFRFIRASSFFDEPSPGQQPMQPKEHHFCSTDCLFDFYGKTNYAPPRSPRELAIIAENNRKVDEARLAAKQKSERPDKSLGDGSTGTRDGFGAPITKTTGKVLQFPNDSAIESKGDA